MRAIRVPCLFLAVLALSVFAVRPATAQSKCAGYKLKTAGRAARCLLKEEARAALDGTLDEAAVATCHAKLQKAFSKAEAKPPCLTTGDAAAIDAKVSAVVADVSGALAPGAPDEKKCQSLKMKVSGAKAKCLLVREGSAVAKGLSPDPLRLMKCRDKFAFVFAQIEAQHHCTTTGDAAAIEATVDAFVDDVVTELTAMPGSPSGAFAP
jgi:hypothetical protein